MYRDINRLLDQWKKDPRRKPLVLQGIRQVGKTYLLKEFGARAFSDTAYFNFEEQRALADYFKGEIKPSRIVEGLSISRGAPIIPGTTLIIFDEIQEAPEALNSLKYFQEKMPEQHIACAGSLLGVSLSQHASFPVGKVDFMTLRPLSFHEYLVVLGEKSLADLCASTNSAEPIPAPLFERLTELLKTYFLTGGMPEPVAIWSDTRDISLVERALKAILRSYELDFAKHVPTKDIPRVRQIWDGLPGQLARENRKFVYAAVRGGARAREYEDAMNWLRNAGLVHKVHRVKKPDLPLSAYEDVSAFKLYLPDVGLLRAKADLPAAAFVEGHRLFTEFKGALAENFALQELLSASDAGVYYWTSEGIAEVEFVTRFDDRVVPIEVKSGDNVRSKSLALYRERYRPATAVRVSLRNLGREGELLSVPLFLAGNIGALIRGEG